MTLTTHWLGTGEDWVITQDPNLLDDPNHFTISDLTKAWVERGSTNLLANGDEIVTIVGQDPLGIDGNPDPGAGPG